MKRIISFILLISIISCGTETTGTEEPPFYLAENGVTIKCSEAEVGDIGVVNGVEYEVVDRNLLIQRRDEGKDLSKVCVSKITDMNSVFFRTTFNQPIGNWDVSSVTEMTGMFYQSSFDQDIRHWDVSSVRDMLSMFNGSQFNQPIGNWDVSSVTDMTSMFRESTFNQDISLWCVTNITSEPDGFATDSPLVEENKPVWGTCPSG